MTDSDWDAADVATRRLSPSAFTHLPAPVREDLQARGCTIPQVFDPKGPHNVITGEFTRPKQIDWAVLCSMKRRSSILVYRTGNVDDVAEIAAADDRDYLQGSGASIYFSRRISTVGADFIVAMNKAYKAGPLPPIDHHGIDDAFVGKASVIRYWHVDRWVPLQGAD
jgi:hypothetical protein